MPLPVSPNPPMPFRKKLLWIAGTCLMASAMVVLGGTLHFFLYLNSPASESPRSVVFRIPKGVSFRMVLAELTKQGVVTHPLYFNVIAGLEDKRKSVQAGEYLLDTGMTPLKILDILTSGRVAQVSVTVPEGWTLREIGARMERRGLGSAAEFMQAARDREQLRKFGIKADSFEGYLFPETYRFAKGIREADIVAAMADQFVKKVKVPAILDEVKASGLNLHAIITLASLIEKETALNREKPLISAVFHNRLRKKMLLQCDPTVIYAIRDFDGNIRKKDLKIDSPYNTYRYPGLPPGPIANPGLESIRAALRPAPVRFLYFVSRKNGSHYFSVSLKEHNRAVRKYQIRRRSS